MFRGVGNQYGFDWRLLAAQAKQESRFDYRAVSKAHAVGLMQILPGTGAEIARELKLSAWSLYDPLTAIQMGGYYDSKMRSGTRTRSDSYLSNLRLMLCAYNAGLGNVRKYGTCPPFPETQTYWKGIFSYWDTYKLKESP